MDKKGYPLLQMISARSCWRYETLFSFIHAFSYLRYQGVYDPLKSPPFTPPTSAQSRPRRGSFSSDEIVLPSGVFTLLTDCYSPTCSRDQLCYSIACPRRLEQQARLNMKPQPGLSKQISKDSLNDMIVSTVVMYVWSPDIGHVGGWYIVDSFRATGDRE
jgi:hypothetical protein